MLADVPPDLHVNQGAHFSLVGRAGLRAGRRGPASSGKTCGIASIAAATRQANRAFHMVVLTRMGRDPRTQAYVACRTAEGKTTSEIMRCLKRFVAREVYRLLLKSPSLTT